MDPRREYELLLTRRQLFGRAATGIGTAALASLLNPALFAADAAGKLQSAKGSAKETGGLPDLPHFAPKAKRVIFLHQSGAPSQIDLFDYKPKLRDLQGTELPASIRMGQRLTGMTSGQANFPVAASMFKFAQHGRSGAWLSELLPHTAKVADDICIIRSMHTNAINHDPAITFIQTGSEQPGRPSMGAWFSYGLGSENQNLPAYIVFISVGRGGDQPLFGRLWGSGFLPSKHQGVKFRGSGDPVLYLSNPDGIDQQTRRRLLDALGKLNQMQYEALGDPEIATRIAQYEMAYRMQTSVPDLVDISKEPKHTLDLYGEDAKKPGTYAANCLLARRLVERGVRFVQMYHRGWDQHGNLPPDIRLMCKQTDQASAGLVQDLKERGMLDETLVVWAGEFGRTVYCQGALTKDNYGRDHHPRNFSLWLAGGGIKGGVTHGATDDFSYNIAEKPVHVHDFQATILHCLGIDHTKLTYKFQGRDFRLTDIAGNVVKDILA